MTSTHDGSLTTDLTTPAKTGAKNNVCTLDNGALFYTRHLSLSKPDGDLLIRPFSFELKAGEHLMIAGPSGCGKSTILRASHGLWPWSSGETGVNKGTSKLIIAQKPHLPLISLKGIVCYPRVSDEFNDASVAEALNKAGLGQLIPGMNDRNKDGSHWERLSGGEKQRISFARILLHRPSLLMLDEVTASLDVKAQDELYGALLDEMPQSAIISISHRHELAQYHNRHAVIENREFSFVSGGPSTPRRAPAPV